MKPFILFEGVELLCAGFYFITTTTIIVACIFATALNSSFSTAAA